MCILTLFYFHTHSGGLRSRYPLEKENTNIKNNYFFVFTVEVECYYHNRVVMVSSEKSHVNRHDMYTLSQARYLYI